MKFERVKEIHILNPFTGRSETNKGYARVVALEIIDKITKVIRTWLLITVTKKIYCD